MQTRQEIAQLEALVAKTIASMQPTSPEMIRAVPAHFVLARCGMPLRGSRQSLVHWSSETAEIQEFWSHSWHGPRRIEKTHFWISMFQEFKVGWDTHQKLSVNLRLFINQVEDDHHRPAVEQLLGGLHFFQPCLPSLGLFDRHRPPAGRVGGGELPSGGVGMEPMGGPTGLFHGLILLAQPEADFLGYLVHQSDWSGAKARCSGEHGRISEEVQVIDRFLGLDLYKQIVVPVRACCIPAQPAGAATTALHLSHHCRAMRPFCDSGAFCFFLSSALCGRSRSRTLPADDQSLGGVFSHIFIVHRLSSKMLSSMKPKSWHLALFDLTSLRQSQGRRPLQKLPYVFMEPRCLCMPLLLLERPQCSCLLPLRLPVSLSDERFSGMIERFQQRPATLTYIIYY